MAMGQTVPSPRAEAQRPRGECEQHQSHSGVMSLSMPWVPRQGIRTLLLLMSHPCYSRERLGGLFSVWVALYLGELIWHTHTPAKSLHR